jgi:hypothetical protein
MHVRPSKRVASQGGQTQAAEATQVRSESHCDADLLLGNARHAGGKRLAPILGELVARLRRFNELDIDDETAALLAGMSAATIDRRLEPERRKHQLKGRSHTKPGTLLKSQIPIRTWAQLDDAVPGFVEIDLVGHEGGNAAGEHAYTLTVTDIATGWTENRSVPNKAPNGCSPRWTTSRASCRSRSWALTPTTDRISSTITSSPGVPDRHITRSRPGNSYDGAHVSTATGRSCAPWSATTATTRKQNWCYSTRSRSSCSHS